MTEPPGPKSFQSLLEKVGGIKRASAHSSEPHLGNQENCQSHQ